MKKKEVEQVRSYYKFVNKAQRHWHDCANVNMNNIPLQEYERRKTSGLKSRSIIVMCCYIAGCRQLDTAAQIIWFIS